MASDDTFVTFVREQLAGAGPISARRMFGEFAIYCGETVVALVCDNQLFVKPTDAGKALLGDPLMARPFPQAKPYFLMDNLDDAELLTAVVLATAKALPVPRDKTVKRKAVKPKQVKKKAAAPRR